MNSRNRITKTSKLIVLLLLAVFMHGCSNDSEDDLIDTSDTPGDVDIPDGTAVTYTANINAIMESACVSCHASTPINFAPFALVNYGQVSQKANSIINRMSLQNGSSGVMPPSGRLPQATIDLVQQWINDGKLEN